jgi:AcrR family transcriptional regulator
MTHDADGESPTRRQLAVLRTVDPARQRAEDRVQAFLDAARELLSSADGKDFTLQQVIDRSGQSLRSFYQHFAGKHELLLAIFDESVRAAADELGVALEDIDDPLDRLRCYVVEYHRLCLLGTARYADRPLQSRAMAQFAQHLLIYQPAEATKTFEPVVSILKDLLDDASRAGAIRSDLDAHTPGFVLQAIMFNAFVPTLAGTAAIDEPESAAERLWDLLRRSLV